MQKKYEKALEYYEKNKKYDKYKYILKMAKCYSKLKDFENSIINYQNAI